MAEIFYKNKWGQPQEYIAIHLPKSMAEVLRDHAEKNNTTMAKVLRQALAEHLPMVAIPEGGE